MSLFRPEAFGSYCRGLPGVTINEQWGCHVAKVGGKVFALVTQESDPDPAIVFKVTEESFEILTIEPGVSQAPYFARRRWVAVAPGGLDDDTLMAYIAGSHRMVAGALTRKLKAEHGLEAYLAGTTA